MRGVQYACLERIRGDLKRLHCQISGDTPNMLVVFQYFKGA